MAAMTTAPTAKPTSSHQRRCVLAAVSVRAMSVMRRTAVRTVMAPKSLASAVPNARRNGTTTYPRQLVVGVGHRPRGPDAPTPRGEQQEHDHERSDEVPEPLEHDVQNMHERQALSGHAGSDEVVRDSMHRMHHKQGLCHEQRCECQTQWPAGGGRVGHGGQRSRPRMFGVDVHPLRRTIAVTLSHHRRDVFLESNRRMGTFSTSTIHAALLSRHAQIPHRHVGDSRPGCVRGPANAATRASGRPSSTRSSGLRLAAEREEESAADARRDQQVPQRAVQETGQGEHEGPRQLPGPARPAKDRRANRKAKVVDLKQKRNRQVAQLKSAQQARLNAIAADRRAAIARINTSYSGKEQRLNKQLAKARKKLIKATNPVVRQNLREQIAAIQDQLATLDQEKRDDLRVANNKVRRPGR